MDKRRSIQEGLEDYFQSLEDKKSLYDRLISVAGKLWETQPEVFLYKVRREFPGLPVNKTHINFSSPESWAREVYRDIRDARLARLAKDMAAVRGLQYWPAMLWWLKADKEDRVDPAAFVAAEEALFELTGEKWDPAEGKWGGWDSRGDKGHSPWGVADIWKKCGYKDSWKFRWAIKVSWPGDPASPGYMKIPWGLSKRKLLAWGRGGRWWWGRGVRWWLRNSIRRMLSNQALVALGMLSPELRYAAVSNLPDKGRIRSRDLNWERVKQIQKERRISRRLELVNAPPRLWWWRLYGMDVPAGLPLDTHPVEAKRRLYESLCKLGGVDPYQGSDVHGGLRLPCWNLARVFSSEQQVRQLLKKYELSLHDAGQFTLPPRGARWNKKGWADFSLRFGPKVLKYASKWAIIEERLGRLPENLQELRAIAASVSYGLHPEDSAGKIAYAAALAHLSQYAYEDYVRWYTKRTPKNSECVPHPGGVIQQLEHDDPVAPLLGEITHCCQHPRGAAADVARALIESPRMAAWVARAGECILQQAAVWVTGEGDLVLDSIEGSRYPGDAEHWLDAAHSVLGKFGIKRVLLGAVYGIESLRKDILSRVGERIEVQTQNCPAEYTDARRAFVIAGGER